MSYYNKYNIYKAKYLELKRKLITGGNINKILYGGTITDDIVLIANAKDINTEFDNLEREYNKSKIIDDNKQIDNKLFINYILLNVFIPEYGTYDIDNQEEEGRKIISNIINIIKYCLEKKKYEFNENTIYLLDYILDIIKEENEEEKEEKEEEKEEKEEKREEFFIKLIEPISDLKNKLMYKIIQTMKPESGASSEARTLLEDIKTKIKLLLDRIKNNSSHKYIRLCMIYIKDLLEAENTKNKINLKDETELINKINELIKGESEKEYTEELKNLLVRIKNMDSAYLTRLLNRFKEVPNDKSSTPVRSDNTLLLLN
jgi:hypothetical protein